MSIEVLLKRGRRLAYLLYCESMNDNRYHLIKSTLFLVLSFCAFAIHAKPLPDMSQQELRDAIKKNSSGVYKVELFEALSKSYVAKKYPSNKDLDSATILNNEARNLSDNLNDQKGLGNSYLISAKIAQKNNDFKSAEKLIGIAIQVFKKRNLNEEIGEAYFILADNYRDTGILIDQKINIYKQALVSFQLANAKLRIAATLKLLSDGYASKSDYKSVAIYLEKSIAVYKPLKYNKLSELYALLGLAYDRSGDLTLGLKHELSALKMVEESGDSSLTAAQVYLVAGVVYYDAQKFDSTYTYDHKALDISVRYKDTASIKDIYFSLVMLLPNMGRLDEALKTVKTLSSRYKFTNVDDQIMVDYLFVFTLRQMHRYADTEPYVKHMLSLYESNGVDDNSVAYVLPSAIQYYFNTKQYDLARVYLKKREAWLSKNHIVVEQADNQLWAFQIDSAQGFYPSAIAHYQTYKMLMDSLTNAEKLQQFNELQVQYNSEKKDNNIQVLTKQNLLQHTKLQKERYIRNGIIAGLITVLLLAGVVYNRYRLKQRTNILLEKKQEEINDQNALLKRVLGEKEWLLREIHHRVKNNLQIVISLLNTQSAYLDNEDALVAIRNSQHRMYAMSLIHQKLYQSENLSSIDMQWYIQELVGYMRECFDADRKIEFTLDVDKIDLDVAQAVPLGLILNEAISNTFKYAFPDKRRGNVNVSLKKTDNKICLLTIADNGIGLPPGFEPELSESLGMSLMKGLSDQIDGDFIIEGNQGLTIFVKFEVHQELTIFVKFEVHQELFTNYNLTNTIHIES